MAGVLVLAAAGAGGATGFLAAAGAGVAGFLAARSVEALAADAAGSAAYPFLGSADFG